MEEKKAVKLKKDEFAIKEFIEKSLGKGKMSRITIEYTPIGEKVIISTNKPGLIIGRGGERIEELTKNLKTRFELENPHVEIDEIKEPELDAQTIADEIALSLERLGPMKFKVIAYRTLQKIMSAGALGAEIRLGGKLPGSRAKVWRFAQGYLKKVGETAKVVDRAKARAQTKPGTVGVKVSILSPYVKLYDKIEINDEFISKMKENAEKIKSEDSQELKKPKKSNKKK